MAWFSWRAEPAAQAIRQYQQTAGPATDTLAQHCRFLVLDVETTGLDAAKHHIVSLGWVEIMQGELALETARHFLVKPPVSVGQSAIYHGLHDHQLQQALELGEVLNIFLQQAAGAVLVAHHARLEQQFLQTACQRVFGNSPRFRLLDTMQIEWQRLLQQNKVVKSDGLRLAQCLSRHQLPSGLFHHALEDAYSCALLLLCQIKQSRSNSTTLGDLYRLSAG